MSGHEEIERFFRREDGRALAARILRRSDALALQHSQALIAPNAVPGMVVPEIRTTFFDRVTMWISRFVPGAG